MAQSYREFMAEEVAAAQEEFTAERASELEYREVLSEQFSAAEEEYKQLFPEESTTEKKESTLLVAGSGSRSLQTADKAVKMVARTYLEEQFAALKEKYDNLEVMSGMAEGFDALLAKTAIDMDIPLIAAVPNKGYGSYYWGKNSLTGENRMKWFNWYLEQAASVVYVMEDVHNTKSLYLGKKHSNFVRNDYMVEYADAFYVYDTGSKGTKHCLAAIAKAGTPYKLVPTA